MSSTSQPPNMTKISSKGRFENMEPDDNDVPQSLLLEANDNPTASPIDDNHMKFHDDTITRNSAGIRQRQMDHGDTSVPASTPYRSSQLPFSPSISKVDAARWRWVNVSNLDNFMRDVYDYFEGGGFWCILCANALWLLETLFVTVLLSFLTQCVDYSKVPKSKALHQVVIDQCTRNMSFKWSIGIWIYSFFFIWKSVQYFFEIRRLIHIRDFYRYLLDIPEQDMQTVSWQDVVARIMLLRDHNPRTATNTSPHLRKFLGSQSKERLDAHDIANRLMRRENYLIAMINKDVLNLSLPVPFLRNRQLFSKTMEWYLHYSILDMVFNERGEVRQEFLRADKRRTLSQKLRQRLIFAGVLNLLLAPIVLAYVVIVYFFTYYNVCSFGSFGLEALIYSEVANVVMQEYQKDPKLAAARKYTALAEWKFREFNELPHIFHERLHMSYPFATRYIDQFPKRLTEDVARSIAFVSGALAAVLAVCTVLDSELFLGFEITKDRTVLFYLGVFGAIWAITRGMISEEATVFNPEYALRNVIEYTHFMPDHWEDRLHSFEVKQEFADFYKMKVVIFMEEVMGIITTPMLLLFSLPSCCEQVVDFFREFTVHVDGLGYVCSFALFDFSRGVGAAQQKSTNADVREDYYSTKHGKMAASYYGFLDNYVVNPKTGIPGHLPPGSRHAFHPPPSFPSLNSPTLPTDVPTSIPGKMDDKLDGFAGKMHTIGTLSLMQSSSLLLDGRNIPSSAGRSLPRTRLFKPGQRLGASHIGQTINENSSGSDMKFDEDDAAEVEAALGESTWQTSPGKGVSREPSALSVDAADGGVLGLIQQFRQAQHGRRTGSIV